MATNSTTFQIVDPRFFDGNPYDVAERAVRQLKGVVELALASYETTEKMVLNGFMERQAGLGEEIDASAWYELPEYRNWIEIKATLEETVRRLSIQEKAAAFNPKKKH